MASHMCDSADGTCEVFHAGTQALQQIKMNPLKGVTTALTLCSSQKRKSHIVFNADDKAGQQP